MVVVNPNKPMTMDDFAAIYTANGVSPEENARQIYFNAPIAGKNYMMDQWSKMGMSDAPETYFSRALAQQKAAAPIQQAAMQTALPGVPMMAPRNESERVLMLNTGQLDPQGITPLQKKLAASYATSDAQATLAAQLEADKATPFKPQFMRLPDGSDLLMNPAEVLQSQTAGPMGGDVTRILRSMRGGNLNKIPTGERVPLTAYVPTGGYGRITPGATDMDRLDRTVYNDPEFQRILSVQPEKAAYVYKKLTGRDYEGDYTTATDLAKQRQKTGYNYASQQIANGAKYDPMTGKWKVWAMADAPEGGMSLSNDPRPFRQLVDATDEQAEYLNRHYQDVTGRPLQRVNEPKGNQRTREYFLSDPVIAAAVASKQKELGRTLTTHDIAYLAQHVNEEVGHNQAKEREARFFGTWDEPGRISQGMARMGDWLRGIDPETRETNFWGDILNYSFDNE